VDYLYYGAEDVGMLAGESRVTDLNFDAYGTTRHSGRQEGKYIERNQLKKVLGESGKYNGAFLDTSGEVIIGKNGIWEKNAVVAESNLEDFSVEEEKFENLEPVENCPEFSLALDESILPKLNLRNDKFLTGTYIWGPNNQLRGMRELVFMAIKMNRTLAMPPFFKHWASDESADEERSVPVAAAAKLDLNLLREFLPIVDPEEMAESCERKIDEFWAARRDFCHGDKMSRIKYHKNELGYTNIDIGETGDHRDMSEYHCTSNTAPIYPSWEQLPEKMGILLPNSVEALEKLYKNEGKCALFLMPYRAFDFKDVMVDEDVLDERQEIRASIQEDKDNVYPESLTPEDQKLMGEIVLHTQRPKYIREISEKFINDVLGGMNFVSIHWRYNVGDWTRHCRKKPSIQCDIVQRIITDVEFVAENTAKYVKTYNYEALGQMKHNRLMDGKFKSDEINENERPTVIYIAHPPDQRNFVDGIKKMIKELSPELTIYSGSDSFNWINQYLKNCAEFKEEIHDVHSMIDQQLCLQSRTFLWAVGSSWSTNILMERHLHGKIHGDAKNTDIFERAILSGT